MAKAKKSEPHHPYRPLLLESLYEKADYLKGLLKMTMTFSFHCCDPILISSQNPRTIHSYHIE